MNVYAKHIWIYQRVHIAVFYGMWNINDAKRLHSLITDEKQDLGDVKPE